MYIQVDRYVYRTYIDRSPQYQLQSLSCTIDVVSISSTMSVGIGGGALGVGKTFTPIDEERGLSNRLGIGGAMKR